MRNRHIAGSIWQSNNHWVVCDVCGLEYRVEDMRLRWDGAAVCKEDYEPRHPQEFIKGIRDDTSPVGDIINPEADDAFNSVIFCPLGPGATAGEAIAGCAVAGDTTAELESISVPTGTFNGSL